MAAKHAAKKQRAALYANEPSARADTVEPLGARPVSRTFSSRT